MPCILTLNDDEAVVLAPQLAMRTDSPSMNTTNPFGLDIAGSPNDDSKGGSGARARRFNLLLLGRLCLGRNGPIIIRVYINLRDLLNSYPNHPNAK